MPSQVDKISDQISIKYYAALPYCVLIYFRTGKLLNLFSLDGLYFYVHIIVIFFPPNKVTRNIAFSHIVTYFILYISKYAGATGFTE